MTRDEIIRMAREAGAMFNHMTWVERDIEPVFQRFAALVAAAEREACAKVCEDDVRTWSYPGSITRAECAAAIRARGKK